MKKLILILFAIFTLSFVSCSNEDEIITPDIEQVEEKIDSTQYYITPDTIQELLLVYETTYQVYRIDGYLPNGYPNYGEGVGVIKLTRVVYIPDCYFKNNLPIYVQNNYPIFETQYSDYDAWIYDKSLRRYDKTKELPNKYTINKYSINSYSDVAEILDKDNINIYKLINIRRQRNGSTILQIDRQLDVCICTADSNSHYIDNIQLTMFPARNIDIECEPLFKYVNWYDYSSQNDPKHFDDLEELQQYYICDISQNLYFIDNSTYMNWRQNDTNWVDKYKESGYSINRLYCDEFLGTRNSITFHDGKYNTYTIHNSIIGKQYAL